MKKRSQCIASASSSKQPTKLNRNDRKIYLKHLTEQIRKLFPKPSQSSKNSITLIHNEQFILPVLGRGQLPSEKEIEQYLDGENMPVSALIEQYSHQVLQGLYFNEGPAAINIEFLLHADELFKHHHQPLRIALLTMRCRWLIMSAHSPLQNEPILSFEENEKAITLLIKFLHIYEELKDYFIKNHLDLTHIEQIRNSTLYQLEHFKRVYKNHGSAQSLLAFVLTPFDLQEEISPRQQRAERYEQLLKEGKIENILEQTPNFISEIGEMPDRFDERMETYTKTAFALLIQIDKALFEEDLLSVQKEARLFLFTQAHQNYISTILQEVKKHSQQPLRCPLFFNMIEFIVDLCDKFDFISPSYRRDMLDILNAITCNPLDNEMLPKKNKLTRFFNDYKPNILFTSQSLTNSSAAAESSSSTPVLDEENAEKVREFQATLAKQRNEENQLKREERNQPSFQTLQDRARQWAISQARVVEQETETSMPDPIVALHNEAMGQALNASGMLNYDLAIYHAKRAAEVVTNTKIELYHNAIVAKNNYQLSKVTALYSKMHNLIFSIYQDYLSNPENYYKDANEQIIMRNKARSYLLVKNYSLYQNTYEEIKTLRLFLTEHPTAAPLSSRLKLIWVNLINTEQAFIEDMERVETFRAATWHQYFPLYEKKPRGSTEQKITDFSLFRQFFAEFTQVGFTETAPSLLEQLAKPNIEDSSVISQEPSSVPIVQQAALEKQVVFDPQLISESQKIALQFQHYRTFYEALCLTCNEKGTGLATLANCDGLNDIVWHYADKLSKEEERAIIVCVADLYADFSRKIKQPLRVFSAAMFDLIQSWMESDLYRHTLLTSLSNAKLETLLPYFQKIASQSSSVEDRFVAKQRLTMFPAAPLTNTSACENTSKNVP